MIRPLREEDYSAAVAIVNDGWRTVYGEYVNPALLSDTGCRERAAELERDFRSRRLEEHVWEEAGEVLALSLGLEQGDIRAPLAAECPRKDLLRRWYEEPEERWERLWRDTLTTVACLRSLPAGETLRIWADNRTPHSACGLLFAAELLRDTAAEVRTVCLPPWRERYDGTVVQYGGWGDVCPGEFGCFLPLEQPLPPNALRMLAARWKELKEENAPLRAVVNGEVRSVEETFYDGLIRKHLPAGEKKVAALIGEILGRERPGIGDIWLADRIRAMIAAGELELVREDPERFYRSVIRRGPCRV